MITIYAQVPDLDVAKYIAAVNGTGYSMSTEEKSAITAFISALKQNGLWKRTHDFAIYPLLGNTADSQKFNLLNPVDSDAAYRLTYYGSPTHNSLGVKGNGTSQYIDVHIPLNAFSSNFSGSAWVQESSAYNIFGNFDSGNAGYGLSPSYTDGKAHYAVRDRWAPHSTYERTFVNADGSQLSTITRTTTTEKRYYRNGALIDTHLYNAVATISITPTLPYMYILAGYKNTVAGAIYSPNTVSFAAFLSGMTDAQAALFYNAVNNLMISLGRA